MPTPDLLNDPLIKEAPTREGYKVLGGVVIYEKLGQGGMGAVYRGKHLRLNIDVAVKVMDPPAGIQASRGDDFIKRFVREAQTAAAVSHQNLIRVYDVNSEANVYYLIMDFVDGESGGDRIKRKARLSEQEAVEIALGAAEGLAQAHRKGVIHRDIKPDNIMIDKDGQVRVTDLGLAKAASGEGEGAEMSVLTTTATAMGSPPYMPPEQFVSAHDVGPQADVWSLGVTLYQFLTGSLPWTDSAMFRLANKIHGDPLPDPKAQRPDLSDGLCAIIRKAVEKQPAQRYANGEEMADALRAYLDSIKTSTKSVLPDAEAGAGRMALVSQAPPPLKTLTMIGSSMLAVPAEIAKQDSPQPAPTGPTGPTLAQQGAKQSPLVLLSILFGAIIVGVIVVSLILAGSEGRPRAAATPPGPGTPALPATLDASGEPAAGDRIQQQLQADQKQRDEQERLAAEKRQAELKQQRVEDETEQAHLAAEAKLASALKAARSLREVGLLDHARNKASEALEIAPDDAETRKLLAEISAEIVSKQTETERASGYKKWMDEGLRLRISEKYKEAATAYERAQLSAPEGDTKAAEAAATCRAADLKAQGIDADSRGDLERAVALYAKSLAASEDPKTRQRLVNAEKQLAEKRAEEKRSAEADKRMAQAADAEKRGDLEQALDHYGEAAKHGADVSAKLSALKQELAARERVRSVKAAYETAIVRARALAGEERWEDAIAACKEALGHKPGDEQATTLMAEAASHLGPPKTLTLDLGRGITMETVLMPAGEFMMGSYDTAQAVAEKCIYGRAKAEWFEREHPQHAVTITQPFYMGKCEVTQAQFELVMKENPSQSKGAGKPAEQVSWTDATTFCKKLSKHLAKNVRLPTEAEWEYACRAGSTTPFSSGEWLYLTQANYNGNYSFGGAPKGPYRGETTSTGSFPANAWGLHDMHGNVWEWCADWYDNDYYKSAAASDPKGPASGSARVLRGGSYYSRGYHCRSAYRHRDDPMQRHGYYGFRVVVADVSTR